MSNESFNDSKNIRSVTVEKLKSYPGLENLSHVEAEQAIDTLYQLAAIGFEIHCLKENYCIENQSVVYLMEQKPAA